jgi:hypothetical protein
MSKLPTSSSLLLLPGCYQNWVEVSESISTLPSKNLDVTARKPNTPLAVKQVYITDLPELFQVREFYSVMLQKVQRLCRLATLGNSNCHWRAFQRQVDLKLTQAQA